MATPARWQRAAERADAEEIAVRRLHGDEWMATRPGSIEAHVLVVRDGIVSCDCTAAKVFDDPVCKHRAAYYRRTGALPREG